MKKEYIAHINEYTDAIQTVQQHSFQTAVLCREYAIPAFKDFLYVIGLLHDIGKYMDEFQKRPQGCPSRSAVQQALNFIKSGQKPRNYAVSGVFPFQMV